MNDIPLGFLFSITNNDDAINYYSTLTNYDKNKITKFIQTPHPNYAVKEKINLAIEYLAKKDMSIFN